MRFDGHKYIHCPWCAGTGCLYCETEAHKAFQDTFPDGLEPIATFTLDELPAVREAIGREAVERAFSPGGGGVDEFIKNIRRVRAREEPGSRGASFQNTEEAE